MELIISERGWAGHFICADRCKFRRNTLIEYGEERVVVSTVGLMKKLTYGNMAEQEERFEEVGCGRFYETMAFKAKFESPYWEADVSEEVNFNSPWSLNEKEFSSDLKANDMHEKVVEEISSLMLKGELKTWS